MIRKFREVGSSAVSVLLIMLAGIPAKPGVWIGPKAPVLVSAGQTVTPAESDLPCSSDASFRVSPDQAAIGGGNIRIEFDSKMRSRVVAHFDTSVRDVPVGEFSESEILLGENAVGRDFHLSAHNCRSLVDAIGRGKRLVLTGKSGPLVKTVKVTLYDDFPRLATFDVEYTNRSTSRLSVRGWTNNRYVLTTPPTQLSPAFWSYQSGSYEKRPSWVVPLKPGFHQDNFLGMNASDYGGGTPVVDVWSRKIGIAVGDLENVPKQISLPVTMPDPQHATLAVTWKQTQVLKPGETLKTFRTFAAVHQGDYFATLVSYRRFMEKQGAIMASAPNGALQPIWCAWGYGRRFQPQQIYDTLPTVKKLGFTWVGVDDGWQTNVGDWALDAKKFPRRDADMKALVDRIHQEGFKAQLWWSPLSAAPDSDLLKKEPDLVLLNRDGSKRKISWWNSYYLCPADQRVVEYHKALVRKIIGGWGFDGLKLDGQHMNAVPPCYNPAHHHNRPEDSVEALPQLFREIYETARSIKPDVLVEFCPCGTAYSFFTMPFFNMAVASDPESSWQVRSKGKTLKALMGDQVAYFGDHVELSDGADDFASTIGVGGVVGSQFVLPALAEHKSSSDLTPERELIFSKWLRIYNQNMPSAGTYLGTLYDIGFDRPEAHAIRKNGSMYYAFFAPRWEGKVELRGLEDREYKVVDYESGGDLGLVRGPEATLQVTFRKHLLLLARQR
jgi:alpha-galactosidase